MHEAESPECSMLLAAERMSIEGCDEVEHTTRRTCGDCWAPARARSEFHPRRWRLSSSVVYQAAIVLACAMSLGLPQASAYSDSFNMTVNIRSKVVRVGPMFGLTKGGEVDVHVAVSKARTWPRQPPPEWLNVYVVFFSSQQWYDYELSEFLTANEFAWACQNDENRCIYMCSLPSVRRFQIWGNPYDSGMEKNFTFNVNEKTEYRLVLLTCASSTHDDILNVEMNVSMVNPGGQHLSIEQVPLEGMYWALSSSYTLMLAVGLWYFCSCNQGLALHKLFVGTIGVKLFEHTCHLAYYRTLSTTGQHNHGLFRFTRISSIFSEAAFLALMLLVSLGWTVTRDVLTRREKQLFWSFFSLFTVFGLLHSACGSASSQIFCQGFLLAFFVVKFLIIFCVIVAANANIERLRSGAVELARPFTHSQLYLKLVIFHNVRWAFLIVEALPIVLMFVEVLVLTWEQAWLGPFLHEMLWVIAFVVLAYVFRFHRHSSEDSNADPAAVQPLQGDGASEANNLHEQNISAPQAEAQDANEDQGNRPNGVAATQQSNGDMAQARTGAFLPARQQATSPRYNPPVLPGSVRNEDDLELEDLSDTSPRPAR